MLGHKEHSDILCELVNIGAGKAGQVLNQMFSSHIILSIPIVKFFDVTLGSDAEKYVTSDIPNYMIEMNFTAEGLKGCAMLLFKNDQVDTLVDALISIPYDDATRKPLVISTLSEVGNIVINALIGSIGNFVQTNIDYSVPKCRCDVGKEAIEEIFKKKGTVIMARTFFDLERLKVDAHCMIILTDSGFIGRMKI